MFRKITTLVLIIIINGAFILGISSFTSCDKASPTIPCNCGDNRDPVGSSSCGTVGDGSVEMQQDYFSVPETGEMVSETAFKDNAGNLIGSAQHTAAQDVVSHVSLQNFNVPGETFIDMGGYFTLKVVISSGETVTFCIDKVTALAKSGADEHITAGGYNETQLTAGISTNSVLLCIGAYDAVDESQVCNDSAEAYCGSRTVDAYLEATFSLANGCESGCKVICKTHDQGAFGS